MATELAQEALVRVLPNGPVQPGEAEALRISLNLLPEPALVFASDGTIRQANPSALSLLEATEDELIGISNYSLAPMESEKTREITAHLAHGTTIRFEMDFFTLKGNHRRVDIISMPVLRIGGKVEVVIGFFRDISERKRAESEQAPLAALVESSDDAIISISPEYKIMTWNKGAQKLLGYTAAEAIGKTNLDLYVPTEHRATILTWMQADLAAIRNDPAYVRRLEWRGQKDDGSAVDVALVVSGIHDLDENVAGLSLIMRDITEPKRARREQALLASIVRSSNDAIYSIGPDHIVQSWNGGAERMFGYSTAEVLGKRSPAMMPETQALLNDLLHRVLDRGETVEFESVRRRKDGTVLDVAITASPMYDSTGTAKAIAAVARDITGRKRAEREQALLAALVNTTDDAIVSLSTDFRILSWNQGAQKLLGYTTEEVLGKSPLDLYIPSVDRAQVEAQFVSILTLLTESPSMAYPLERQITKKDGTLVDVTTVGCGIRDPSGNLLGLSWIMRDVSELKRKERDEARYAAIVGASNDAIINTSPEGKIEDWNPAAERVYGYTAREAIGQGIELFTSPEELPRTIAAARQVVETRESASFVQYGRSKSGTHLSFPRSIFSRSAMQRAR